MNIYIYNKFFKNIFFLKENRYNMNKLFKSLNNCLKGVKKMNRKFKTILLSVLSIFLLFGVSGQALAVEEELVGEAIIVYGANLTDEEESEVRELLEVDEHEEPREHYVTGEDYHNYIDGRSEERRVGKE